MNKEDLGLNSKPIRPLDKSALSNDSATLRALTGMLNNPLITGAEMPKEERYDGPAGKNGETITTLPPTGGEQLGVSPAPAAVASPFPSAQSSNPRPEPVPAAPTSSPTVARIGTKLLLTGRGLVDIITAIGAINFNVTQPAYELSKRFFGEAAFPSTPDIKANPGADSFIATIKAWGSGEITAAFPITPARAIFIQMIKSLATLPNALPPGVNWHKFGSGEGFWIDACVSAANAAIADLAPGGIIVITGITNKHEFEYIRAQGFTHWHSTARPGIGGTVDPLSGMLDNDVTKVVSVQKNGPKLRCIWKDSTAPVSNRLLRNVPLSVRPYPWSNCGILHYIHFAMEGAIGPC